MMEQGQGQLIGFNSREGQDGWYTSLNIVVRTDGPPDIGTLSRWLSQVARATNNKIGNSPVPIPKPRARLSAPKTEPAPQPMHWNGDLVRA
jgi:hypothetical protein